MSMSVEVVSASNFLVHLVRITRTGVSELQLQAFRDCQSVKTKLSKTLVSP